jgi:hypothetical protein
MFNKNRTVRPMSTICSLTKSTETDTHTHTHAQNTTIFTPTRLMLYHTNITSLVILQPFHQQVTSREMLCQRRCNSSFLAHTELVFGQTMDQSHFHLHQSKPHPEKMLILSKSGSHSSGRFAFSCNHWFDPG